MDTLILKTQHTNANRINHIYPTRVFKTPWFCRWYHMGASHWWMHPPSLSPGETLWGIAFFFELISFVWPMELTLGIFVAFVFWEWFVFCGCPPLLLKVAISIGHWLVLSSEPLLEKWKMGGWKPWENMTKSASFFFFSEVLNSTSFSFFPHTKIVSGCFEDFLGGIYPTPVANAGA